MSEPAAPSPGAPPQTPAARLALRVGTPEFAAAEAALSTHFAEKRIDSAEFERRMEACKATTTQGELLRVFADLPEPHPDLPGLPPPLPLRVIGDKDDDLPVYGAACILAILLGVPVAVVLGAIYDAWWLLAVPVAFCVLLVAGIGVVERLRRR
ncbi:DUF1707 SHOCT-like domain-containing protein [Phytohabitans suffuscus]|uniref:DUF1707 domain-containing protein n=1 Tax=Phytohabitans suffuscus TaxID=624315 RepID=A0A6F8YZ22_9ACTN|nr:DUF1707 domain-containing protein [Phytohabitans suffuscus]BCB91178.1 hypothetical protein Psuf_084910 [Phytohabitans suffuscus]